MTQISYISGIRSIPADEMSDRGKEVGTRKDYISYLGLSEGQFGLMLLREQLKIYTKAYRDFPQYKKALTLVENALITGVHVRPSFVGVIPDSLQDVARIINQSKYQTSTAGGSLFNLRSLDQPVQINGPIIPITTADCKYLATVAIGKKYYGSIPSKWPTTAKWESINNNDQSTIGDKKREWLKLIDECAFRKEMEKLLNDKLESSSYHVLYKDIDSNYPQVSGSAMNLKRILHNSGIETLANAAGVSTANMNAWTEVGVLRAGSNSTVGPMGSVEAGFGIATGGDDTEYIRYKAYLNDQDASTKWINGYDRIGIAPAVVAALIALVGAALAAAAQIVSSVNGMKVAAMASAQGYGTVAYSAQNGDLNRQVITPTGTDGILTYAAIGLGAYLLLSDEK